MGDSAVLLGVVGIVIAGVLGYLFGRSGIGALAATLAARDEERQRAAAETLRERRESEERVRERDVALASAQRAERESAEALASLKATRETERRATEEQLAFLAKSEERLTESFSKLAGDVLQQSGASFLEMASGRFGQLREGAAADIDARKAEVQQLVTPIKESLEKLQGVVSEVEKHRIGTFSALENQIKNLSEGQVRLSSETQNLVKALRAPQVRGRWGELQLRKVVEFAGMERHCDFTEQTTVVSDDARLRPDLLVNLPGRKTIVVDAKVPLQAYLDALEAPDEATKERCLDAHARQLRAHIDQLSAKSYWDQFEHSPDFVILFVPGESFLTAACQQDPQLQERGFSNNVLLAGPTTLIGLLKTIAYGWRQEQVAENAAQIRDLGQDLHDRISKLAEHFARVGASLKSAVGAYNATVGTLESRVLVSGRKFKELGVESPAEIQELEPVDVTVRPLESLRTLSNGEVATLPLLPGMRSGAPDQGVSPA
ncbi:MAG: DNA recombination protein RmuC [Gemmatimonadaceae bacterium]